MRGAFKLLLLRTAIFYLTSSCCIFIFFPLPAQTTGDTMLIRAILDSVSISRIYQTVEHLSGEEPYQIDGKWDSIMTRYSNSPQIYKVQHYLQNRLEQMGYTVDLSPFKGTVDYLDIKFAPNQSNTGWMSGSNGKIYGTNDGGQSWSVQYTGDSSSFYSLFALDSRTVWAIGNGGTILKTGNGVSWHTQSSQIGNHLSGIYFLNANLGWICGDQGIILKTSDGGVSWETRANPSTNKLYDVFFTSENEGWAAGDHGTLIHTSNGGETWVLQNTGTGSHLHGIHFLNSTKGFAVGSLGTVLKTTNGGTDWTILMESSTGDYYYDIDFVDQNTGIIVGNAGSCLKTTDGGTNWKGMGKVQMWWVNGMDMLDANTIWASGSKMVAFSTDSGSSWASMPGSIPEENLNNVFATKTGVFYPDDYYILCAHYDATSESYLSRAPGADDNASGTAAVIEAARVLADYSFPYSIRFILFAGEEQGKVGSAVYARQATFHGEKIHGVINLDMIGYDGNNDGRMGIHSGMMEGSLEIGNFVKSKIDDWGFPLDPQVYTSESSRGSDHDSFWYFGYPAIMIIEDLSDKNPFYHTIHDRLSALRQSYFHAMARLAIGSLATLVNSEEYIPLIVPDPLLGSIDNPVVGENTPFILHPSYPNPFSETVNFSYYVRYPARITGAIFNTLGQPIYHWGSISQEAGEHTVSWQPVNAKAGIYYLHMQAGEQVVMQKLILVR